MALARPAALIAVLLLSACNHAYFVTDSAPGETFVENNPFFLWGLVGENTVDTRQMCPHGVAEVHTYETVIDGLASGFTLGLYSPRTIEITCAAKRSSEVRRVLLTVDAAGQPLAMATETGDGHTTVRQVTEVTR
jgi:hypothetical protein